MLTVHDYVQIRAAHAGGESIRSMARRLRCAPKTIRKVLSSPTGAPPGYRRSVPASCPKLGPYLAEIERVLADDRSAPVKQRHTAMQVHRRLVAEGGYRGGYDQVRRFVQRHRRAERETFVPLSYVPGHRLECDFGHLHVDYPAGRRLVSVLVATWSFSQALFLMTDRVRLYVDVSGSVLHFISDVIRAVLDCRDLVHPTVHLFSTTVSDARLPTLARGFLDTTLGTDIACVAQHAAAHRVRRAVIITDGMVGRARGAAAQMLADLCLGVAYTTAAGSWTTDLRPFADHRAFLRR